MTGGSQPGEVTSRSDTPGPARACQQVGALQASQEELRLQILNSLCIKAGPGTKGTS